MHNIYQLASSIIKIYLDFFSLSCVQIGNTDQTVIPHNKVSGTIKMVIILLHQLIFHPTKLLSSFFILVVLSVLLFPGVDPSLPVCCMFRMR